MNKSEFQLVVFTTDSRLFQVAKDKAFASTMRLMSEDEKSYFEYEEQIHQYSNFYPIQHSELIHEGG
jgi:hypothetical protein